MNHIHEPRGKVGFALLLKTTNDLKMVIYRTKQEVLSTTLVLESFYLYVKDSFLQFADDIGALWSITFDTEFDKEAVLKIMETRCHVQRDERFRSFDSRPSLEEIKEEKSNENHDEKQNKQQRANILSRMAKMGKKIVLPKTAAAAATNNDLSDNSSDNDIKGDYHKPQKPHVPPRNKHNNRHHNNSNVPQLQIAQIGPGPGNVVGPINTFTEPHIIPQFISSTAETNLNLMLSENRIQNTEIRFNLSKLENKVEKILDRVDLLNTSGSGCSADRCTNFNRDEEIIELDEKLLALKKENLNLKFKIRDLEIERERVEQYGVGERGMHSPNPEFDENELKNDNESLRKLNQNISLELERIAEEMKSLEDKIDDNNALMEAKDVELKAKDSQIEEAIRQLEEFKVKLESEEKQNINLQKQLQEVSSNVSKLEFQHSRPDSQDISCQTESYNDTNNNTNNSNNELIKEIMNNLYFKLCDKIQNLNENEMKQSEILKNIGQTIKQETNEALRKTKGDS